MPVRDVRFHPNSQCKNHIYHLRCSFILLSPLHCWVILLRMFLICSEKSVTFVNPWTSLHMTLRYILCGHILGQMAADTAASNFSPATFTQLTSQLLLNARVECKPDEEAEAACIGWKRLAVRSHLSLTSMGKLLNELSVLRNGKLQFFFHWVRDISECGCMHIYEYNMCSWLLTYHLLPPTALGGGGVE